MRPILFYRINCH